MSESKSLPTHQIWQSLLDGDPGPAVAFFDSLAEADFGYAAGGFLQDISDRLADAHEYIGDEAKRDAFVAAVQQVLEVCDKPE